MQNKEALLGKTQTELIALVKDLGMPGYVGKQICEWLYKKHVRSFDEMLNISKANKQKLSSAFDIGFSDYINVQESVDGTKKYLFKKADLQFVEAAYIPEKERATLCVSSQVGCKMGCLFCATGKQGFQAQLTAGEIINQIRSLPERANLTNVVYMGMGEPFDNLDEVLKSLEIITSDWGFAWSPRRITVSTIGIIPSMQTFLNKSEAHLAVSLHTPFDEERAQIMPIQNVYSIKDVVNELRSWDFGRQRRISFEYIVFGGLNDSPKHVKELTRLLHGLRCRINLIRFHQIPGSPLPGTNEERLQAFREELNAKGLITTIRASRGEDIYAACGLLSTKEKNKG